MIKRVLHAAQCYEKDPRSQWHFDMGLGESISLPLNEHKPGHQKESAIRRGGEREREGIKLKETSNGEAP